MHSYIYGKSKVLKPFKYILVCWVVALSAQMVFSQAGSVDCISATPVCTTFYHVGSLSYPPNTIPNEINGATSCLSNGEQNGVWYTFTVQTGGVLSFNIRPLDTSDDYDWALFDITNNPCSDIFTNPALEVSCNYSNSITNNGITGANGGPNNQDEPTIPVVAGQTFVLFISNFNASTNGYDLDFGASSASIPDNSIPSLVSAVPSDSCGATSVIVTFSESVTCGSISPGDFTFTGPGGPIAISSISGCGGQYSEVFNLNLATPMTQSGLYTLTLTGGVMDVCGNSLNGPVVFNMVNNALDVTVNVVDATCGNNDGSATAVVNGGHGPFNFVWDTGFIGNPIAGLARGPHWVTAVDALGCTVTVNFNVNDPTSFTFTLNQLPDTCSKGNGVINVNVVGTTAPYIYNFVGAQIGPGSSFTNAIGDSTYIVIVTDNMGCWWPDTITMLNVTNDSLNAYFTTLDQEVDFLYPTGSYNNQSDYETSVEWLVDGQNLFGNNLTYTFPTYGDYPVTLVAFDQNGCRDSFTMMITVKVILDLFIPNAITTNEDGLNEIFYVKGIGMDTSTFELRIFDSYGREIFTTNDLTQGWNGKSQQGANLTPQDVYVYRVFVRDIYGDPYIREGRITVIR
jgi:gliding motility-associated-like protein